MIFSCLQTYSSVFHAVCPRRPDDFVYFQVTVYYEKHGPNLRLLLHDSETVWCLPAVLLLRLQVALTQMRSSPGLVVPTFALRFGKGWVPYLQWWLQQDGCPQRFLAESCFDKIFTMVTEKIYFRILTFLTFSSLVGFLWMLFFKSKDLWLVILILTVTHRCMTSIQNGFKRTFVKDRGSQCILLPTSGSEQAARAHEFRSSCAHHQQCAGGLNTTAYTELKFPWYVPEHFPWQKRNVEVFCWLRSPEKHVRVWGRELQGGCGRGVLCLVSAGAGVPCLAELWWSCGTRTASHSTQLAARKQKEFSYITKMCLSVWAAAGRTSRSRILFAFPPPEERCHSGVWFFGWLLSTLTAQHLILDTSFLCSLVLPFPSAVPCHWLAPTVCAHWLCCILTYVVPSKIISVGVPAAAMIQPILLAASRAVICVSPFYLHIL